MAAAPRPDGDPDPEFGAYRESQVRRTALRQEASRILDDRLNLTKEAAPWNIASYGTLTVTATAAAITLALTGFMWWTALPAATAMTCLWLLTVSFRQMRHTSPRRRYRDEELP